MTVHPPSVDLDVLARERGVPPPPRRWGRYVLPLVLVLGFGGALAWAFRDAWTDPIEVTVVRPRSGIARVAEGSVAFQAAGWVEPDPYPLEVVALTTGTVLEVLVEESDVVTAGGIVARLVRADAELERRLAEADLSESEADITGARAEHRRRVEAVGKKGAQIRVLEEELTVQQLLEEEGASGPRQVELAEARLAEARSELAGVEAEADLAAATIPQAEARRDRRALLLEQAELALERTTVRSLWDGIVLERLAAPGSLLHGHEGAGGVICALYDPDHLRIRVDVPQESIASVSIGQQAQILSEGRRGQAYSGAVMRLVPRADIQKVTLEVQVRVHDPDKWLRPEMLCQVRFLEPERDEGVEDQPTLLIPAALLVDANKVWVVSADGDRAVLRTLTVGERIGDEVSVIAGLNLSDELIDRGRESLTDGCRIRTSE